MDTQRPISRFFFLYTIVVLLVAAHSIGIIFRADRILRVQARSLLQNGVPPLTFLPESATKQGAVCLDGSSPAYSMDFGSGTGLNNWIVHLQGGGWCGNASDCLQRSTTYLGSSNYMTAFGFGGLLSNSPSDNPDFYNWNRVYVRYCDGGSFSGNADSPIEVTQQNGQTTYLYFRGQQVWEAIIDDLINKGMSNANQAILSGDSAGGLATFFHCNRFQQKLPQTQVKCLCDAGFFMDIPNIAGLYSFKEFFQAIVALHKITLLPTDCTSKMDQGECFYPQYNLGSIQVPLFLLQTPYDSFQVQYILAPPGSYSNGLWDTCRQDLSSCSTSQLAIIQDQLSGKMLEALHPLVGSKNWGLFMPSCYYHTTSVDSRIWNGATQINNMNAATAFHQWYFEDVLTQDIDCNYPCNPTCVNTS